MSPPLRVLVLGEEAKSLREALAGRSDTVVEQATGLEHAVDRLRISAADVVLVCLAAHDAGVATLRGLREASPAVPVVGVTPAVTVEVAAEAMAAGAQDLLEVSELDAERLARSLRLAVERTRALAALRESEERYALAVQGANDGLWDWHLVEDRIHFSARWKAMLGFEPDELESTSEAWFGRVHPDDLDEVKRRLAGHVEGRRETFEVEYRIHHRDGHPRWMLARGLAIRDETGRAFRIAGSQTDITKRKEAERRLQHQALHDEVTGLPNRALLRDRLSRAMLRQQRHGIPFAVVALCLDQYTSVTDSYGHKLSEVWMRAVADSLGDLRGPTDTLARVGRDQFVLLVDNPTDLTEVLRLADRLQQCVQAPMEVEGEEIFSPASVGIVAGDGQRETPENYLRDASVAMNRARSMGGGQHRVFDTPMHRHIVERLQVEKDLRRAIERREFRIRYQPIVSLRSGQVGGFEALLRWEHPRRGLVGPGAFIDTAEATGLLPAIFDVIFPDIVEQLTSWQARFPRPAPLFVNVNLSRGQLTDPRLVDRVDRVLSQHPVVAGSLGFELTESMMVEDASVLSTLRALKARDVRLLLDDFGTGYSSLANLMSFPIDAIKIDRSFLRELGAVGDHTEIVRAIVSLAHSMAMDVTVEGIESDDQLRFVTGLGSEYGQGFHFAAAVAPDEATEVIAQGYRLTTPPPASGPVARGQSRGRVALLFDDLTERSRVSGRLRRMGYEPLTPLWDDSVAETLSAEQPESILLQLDATTDAIDLLRALVTSPQTAAIPLVGWRRGDESDAVLERHLVAGVRDFVERDAPRAVLRARLDGHIGYCRAQKRLSTIAMVDELTGVFSRPFLVQALRRAVKTTTRGGPSGLAVMVVDPDHFKRVNSTHGADEGDRVLRHIARTIDRVTRETDLVARYGGEEFVVVLHDTTHQGAELVAEKIRASVERRCDTTVSIGGAFVPVGTVEALSEPEDIDNLIGGLLGRAEAAMQSAKEAGRNRVVFGAHDDEAVTA